MKAMVLHRLCDLHLEPYPLRLQEVPEPIPGPNQIRIRVEACGVCHTELDEIEGRTPPPRLPVIPGHEVVGRVESRGSRARRFHEGDRVGVGWIHHSSGAAHENLDPAFSATGRDVDGGYAELMTVDERYAQPVPASFSSAKAAPLLCAGAVGYRALSLCGLRDGQALGLTGFGGSAHLVLQLARCLYPNSPICVFAREAMVREFALELGAAWAGAIRERAPFALDAIIDTTPAWLPVVEAMANLKPGGRLVINAIRKEDRDKQALLDLDYGRHLWLEKEIKSVANVTAGDIARFLPLAEQAGIDPQVQCFPLEQANEALGLLKRGGVRGAYVLVPPVG
ncbi:MAG: alcohol dehydrogenase catalytic domain-containing protein [Gammaproteobacteria bacterium]|nr:alcohol dehydrogenase catalytic domain-containing protein [Gammaproteobacteria bacterium]